MTVLTNDAPVVTPRGSVLGAFVPKPRARTTTTKQIRERVGVGTWLRSHARQVKDGVVAAVAFGCCDVAAFEFHAWAGWLSVGVSLLLIDHSIDRGGGDDERAA